MSHHLLNGMESYVARQPARESKGMLIEIQHDVDQSLPYPVTP